MPEKQPDYILRTVGLTRFFGKQPAVNKVSLNISRGDFVSIIGPNGAGKTTFFNLITGALKPDSGSIFFQGQDITGLKELRQVRVNAGSGGGYRPRKRDAERVGSH